MATRSEKMRAGVFLISAVFILIGILTFTGYLQLREEGVRYHSLFKEVSNLSAGAPVKYNGVQIGKVEAITFAQNTPPAQIRVTYLIKEPQLITNRTVAQLGYISPLSGQQYIDLETADEKKTETSHLPPGNTIPSKSSEFEETFITIKNNLEQMNRLLEENRTTFSELLRNSNRMLDDVHALFSGTETPRKAAEGSLLHVVDSTDQAVNELTRTAQTLREAVDRIEPSVNTSVNIATDTATSMRKTAEEIHATTRDIRQLIKSEQFQTNIDNLSATLAHIEKMTQRSSALSETLQQVSTNVNNTLQENRPSLRRTMRSLEDTTQNLKDLSSRLRQNPSALIHSEIPTKRKISD